MNVQECYLYVQDRLNSLSTNKGDNIPKHVFVRAFNSAQDVWVEDRYKLNSINTLRDDELQPILVSTFLSGLKKDSYWEFDLPTNYYHFKRAIGNTPCPVYIYKKKEDEVNRLLSDDNWKPSLEWEETFCTILSNKIRVYGDFNIDNIEFFYYRKPKLINMEDGYSNFDGEVNTDINPEFENSSLIEILNMTCLILSSDISDQFRYQTMGNNVANK